LLEWQKTETSRSLKVTLENSVIQVGINCKMLKIFFKNSFQPVAVETTGVCGNSTAPFLSGLAKKLVDMLSDPSERQCFY